MIKYQFGDIDAYGAAIRPLPRRCTQSARRFSPTCLLLANFGPIADRQEFDTQLHRNLQVIDDNPNPRDKEDTCLL